MGLDINSTKFLIYAKSLNVDFTKTAMIGRQRLRLRPYDLRKNLRQSAVPFNEETINLIFLGSNGYAEEFLLVPLGPVRCIPSITQATKERHIFTI